MNNSIKKCYGFGESFDLKAKEFELNHFSQTGAYENGRYELELPFKEFFKEIGCLSKEEQTMGNGNEE